MNETMVYTVREVATILRTSPNYVYKLIEKGYLPAIRLGSVRILKKSLEQFLMANQGNDLSNIDKIKKLDIKKMESHQCHK